MLDIVISLLGVISAMLTWWAVRTFYAWKWPNEEANEIVEEVRERNNNSADEIAQLNKEHRKQVIAPIKSRWEKLFLQE